MIAGNTGISQKGILILFVLPFQETGKIQVVVFVQPGGQLISIEQTGAVIDWKRQVNGQQKDLFSGGHGTKIARSYRPIGDSHHDNDDMEQETRCTSFTVVGLYAVVPRCKKSMTSE